MDEDYDEPSVRTTGKRTWMFLALFLLVLVLIMSMFYAYTVSVYVDPRTLPIAKGDYGVYAGVRNKSVYGCPDADSGTGECVYNVGNLSAAVSKCSQKSDLCKEFYFDGSNMVYTVPENSSTVTIGGTYVRQNEVLT